MRFIFFLFLIIIVGCASTSYLTQEQSEKVFSHDVSLTKEQIKQKLLVFINENYYSGKSVLQTNEDGLLSGNGTIQIYEFAGHPIFMDVTFIVKYDEKNYRVKWIVKDIKDSKQSYARGYWGHYTEYIEKSIQENDSMMYKYLSTDQTDF